MNTFLSIMGAALVCLMAGCGNNTPQQSDNTQPTQPSQATTQSSVSQAPQGREETKTLVAAKLVGYDGTAIRQSVDKALDKNDKRQKEMEEEMK